MTNDKQIRDSIIADAMAEYKRNSPLYYGVSLQEMYDEGYQAAIAATHEQYKPLVEALRKVQNDLIGLGANTELTHQYPHIAGSLDWLSRYVDDGLASLPEELENV